MRFHYLAITIVVLAVGAMTATAQDRIARTPSAMDQAAGANVSQAQAAIDQAAAAQKYAFIFFWRDKNQQTDKAWNTFQQSAAKLADTADVVSIQVTDPNEKHIVDRYNVSRAPMPLVLSVAPCGAITKGFNGNVDEKQLRTALVSQCTQLCLKAIQNQKLVLLCVVDQTNPQNPVTIPKGVEDFKANTKVGPATEIVLVNARDESEATFLKDFQVDTNTQKPVVLFIAPPGSLVGKFNGTVTSQQLMAQLVSAQSNPCAGGKCGPNGCGPKK
jgi:hypothetical protein